MKKFNVTFDVEGILEDACFEIIVFARNETEAIELALQEIGGSCNGYIVSEL